ncbi:MAG: hypothetical protein ACP5NS_04070 [Candidatus Pacearchaeota archaeon]
MVREERYISFSHVYLYYLAFAVILTISGVFYFLESKPGVTAFATYDPQLCIDYICPYWDHQAQLAQCAATVRPPQGISASALCNYCITVWTCASHPPDGNSEEKSEGSSGSSQSSSSNAEPTPTKTESATSSSIASQTSSATEYAQNVAENIFSSSGTTSGSTSSSTSSSSGSVASPTFVSSTCLSSSNQLECTKDELILADKKITSVENLINEKLANSNELLSKYSTDSQIKLDNLNIIESLKVVGEIHSQINSQLSLVTDIAFMNAKKEAQEQIFLEAQKSELLNYYDNLEAKIPVNEYPSYPKNDFISGGPLLVDSLGNDCVVPLQNILFKNVKGGIYGITPKGKECLGKPSTVTPYVPSPGGNGNSNGGPPVGITPGPGQNSHSSGPDVAVFLIGESLDSSKGREAVTIAHAKGVISIGFLLAPTQADLEKKITDFTTKLFFGSRDSPSDSLDMVSSPVLDSSVYSRSPPFFLWAILVFLLVPFIFLGNLILLDESRMIFQGQKYLIKKDFESAVKTYASLVSLYESLNDEEATKLEQKIKQYKSLLVNALDASSVKYKLVSSLSFPQIMLLSGVELSGSISNRARVEKLIDDAILEVYNNRSFAIKRLDIITNLYNQLDSISKKNLASKYETLTYLLRKN